MRGNRSNEISELIRKEEILTLADRLEKIEKSLASSDDLKSELKGPKVFLGGMHPGFKEQFIAILGKMGSKRSKS